MKNLLISTRIYSEHFGTLLDNNNCGDQRNLYAKSKTELEKKTNARNICRCENCLDYFVVRLKKITFEMKSKLVFFSML